MVPQLILMTNLNCRIIKCLFGIFVVSFKYENSHESPKYNFFYIYILERIQFAFFLGHFMDTHAKIGDFFFIIHASEPCRHTKEES